MTLATITRIPRTTAPTPPTGLSREGRKLWSELQTTYAITDPGGLLLLELAASPLTTGRRRASSSPRKGSP